MTKYSVVEFANKTYCAKRTRWGISSEWLHIVVRDCLDLHGNIVADEHIVSYAWENESPRSFGLLGRNMYERVVSFKAGFAKEEDAWDHLKFEAYPKIAVREMPLPTIKEISPSAAFFTESLLDK